MIDLQPTQYSKVSHRNQCGKVFISLLLPTVVGGILVPSEDTSVGNQDVQPGYFLLYLVAEFVDRFEPGKVNETELDILMASCRLDVYLPH